MKPKQLGNRLPDIGLCLSAYKWAQEHATEVAEVALDALIYAREVDLATSINGVPKARAKEARRNLRQAFAPVRVRFQAWDLVQ